MNYTDKQLEDLINNVYAGIITPKNLPLDLYNVTLDRLTAAIVKGFGTDFAEDSADALLFEYYKHNIAIFSGAKTFQQVKDMTNLVMTSNGIKRDFSEFKKIIKGDQFHDGLFKTYNENYLKTEFNTAFATAQMGREWNEFASEAEIFPYLKYVTVKDERVRHNHKPFDGVVRPVGDSFWDSHMPPNGFNCRCYVLQLEEGEETTDTQIKKMPDVDSPLFAFNPGKSGRIFDESIHPYTKNIEERYKVDAAKNWGLPTPPKPTKKIKTPTIAAPVPAEAVSAEYIPLKNIKLINEYGREVLGLEFSDFTGMNVEVANSMMKGAFENLKAFPELKDIIKGFGSHKARLSAINNDLIDWIKTFDDYGSYANKYGKDYADRWVNTVVKSLNRKNKTTSLAYQTVPGVNKFNLFDTVNGERIKKELYLEKYNGIFTNTSKVKNAATASEIVTRNRASGWFAHGSDDFSYIITHEYGHAIDDILDFKNDKDFLIIFEREHEAGINNLSDRLSRYGATAGNKPKHKRDEMIAEAWAEYITSKNPRELSKEIGDLIMKKYKQKTKL